MQINYIFQVMRLFHIKLITTLPALKIHSMQTGNFFTFGVCSRCLENLPAVLFRKRNHLDLVHDRFIFAWGTICV
jgi:hypothetical protein